MRHGVPVDSGDWSGDDFHRPLTPIGEAQVERVVSVLHRRGDLAVDRVLASPLTRAQQTAEIAARVLCAPLEMLPALGGAGAMAVFQALESRQELPARLLLVGHSPDMSILLALLAGGSSFDYPFDRSTIARLEGELARGGLRLLWRLSPSEVR